jgi:hypothetical protein
VYDSMCVTGSQELRVRVRVSGRGEKQNKTKPRRGTQAKRAKQNESRCHLEVSVSFRIIGVAVRMVLTRLHVVPFLYLR